MIRPDRRQPLKRPRLRQQSNWPGRIFRLCVLLYVQTLVLVVAVEFLWPRDGVPAEADAIVCLGGGASAFELGRDSHARAQRCVDLFQESVAPVIVFTGTGAAPLMADLAQARGVARDSIVVEADSRSTLQNALFTGRVIMPEGSVPTAGPARARVVLVSDAYHLPRAWIAFRVMGFQDMALVAAAPPSLRPWPLLREALATWFNAGRVALWWATPWLDADRREDLLI